MLLYPAGLVWLMTIKLYGNKNSILKDPTELVLLSLVIFFSADMLDLKDRPTVEQIQIKFVLLLQKYINIRCVG